MIFTPDEVLMKDRQAVARKVKPFGRSFITNNVPYLLGTNSLNDGHSTQAPAGFIEGVLDRVADQFKK